MIISEVEHIFKYFLAISMSFLGKNVYLVPLPIFQSDCLFCYRVAWVCVCICVCMHEHTWRDYGSRVQAAGGSSAWGSGPLTAALL